MNLKKEKNESLVFHPFENLKDIIRRKKTTVAKKSPVKKVREPENEEALFRDAMRAVREIREYRDIPMRNKKPCPPRRKSNADTAALKILQGIITGTMPVDLSDTAEFVQWKNPGVRTDITRTLHDGRYSVQDCLDLHGFTFNEAELEIDQFLKQALQKRLKCIKIIHGRGLRSPHGPVLKEAVVKWLSGKYRKYVLAFVTARQCDGGLGALYVLLQ